jgi:hypothetical protein
MPIPTNTLLLQYEGRVKLALKAFQASHFQTHCTTAAVFNVSYWAIDKRSRGISSRTEALPNGQKLTNNKEETIVQYILDLDTQGIAPHLSEVVDIAGKLLGKHGSKPVGWY